jgi:hypothetical protein
LENNIKVELGKMDLNKKKDKAIPVTGCGGP